MSLSTSFAAVIEKNDRLFERFFHWLAGQYDHKSGGFYYARSSFDMEGFSPDIESTAMALNILQRSGLLEGMPDDIRLKMIRFFQSKQDQGTGYFYDQDEHMPNDEVMVARALAYCSGSLAKLGGEPRYPLPCSSTTKPEYLKSPADYVAWLQRVDLRNSWRGCDLMGSANHYLRRMSEGERKPFVEAALSYFNSIQDPETGLWGEGSLYIRISGTFKLRGFYLTFGIPMPRMDRIYETMLYCLRSEKAVDMCWVRNPVDLLGCFYGMMAIPDEELLEIMEITYANMSHFLKPDGGFSREIDHSPPAPNVAQVKAGEYYSNMPKAVRIGQGLAEGDMNAGTQTLWIRELFHRMAKLDPAPLTAYTGHFWDNIRN